MKILVLSWEYPPHILGGLGKHVYALSNAFTDEGVEVHVITRGEVEAPLYEMAGNVHLHRAPYYSPPPRDFHTMVLQTNFNMVETALKVVNSIGDIDIIHAHDWLVAHAGKLLKHTLSRPLVATIHATEWGRNQGLHNDLQRYISDVEWWLAYEAWNVICCSEYMRNEIKSIFQIPDDKIRVIPNGVDVREFESDVDTWKFKHEYAAWDEKVIFFVGRLVREKGVDTLIEAIPKILSIEPKAKFLIAGKGPALEGLKNKAATLGVAHKVYFTGYIDDATRNGLYKCAEVAVFPSLYEPFGIVALEAMAAKAPVVVGDVGGFSEVVRDDLGVKVQPGDSDSLAAGILKILQNPSLGQVLRDNGYREVTLKYNWRDVAKKTLKVFQDVLREYEESPWKKDVLFNMQHMKESLTGDFGRYRVTH